MTDATAEWKCSENVDAREVVVSCVRLVNATAPGLECVEVWSRDKMAGWLTVGRGDGAELMQRLRTSDRRQTPPTVVTVETVNGLIRLKPKRIDEISPRQGGGCVVVTEGVGKRIAHVCPNEDADVLSRLVWPHLFEEEDDE